MASTKPSSSEDAKELKEKIRGINRKFRLKVNKAYVGRIEYRNNSPYGLEEKMNGLVNERDDLKKEKLKLMKKNDKLKDQKQRLKAKILDLNTAYHASKHFDRNEEDNLSSCSSRCCDSSEDSLDEDFSEDSSDENRWVRQGTH